MVKVQGTSMFSVTTFSATNGELDVVDQLPSPVIAFLALSNQTLLVASAIGFVVFALFASAARATTTKLAISSMRGGGVGGEAGS